MNFLQKLTTIATVTTIATLTAGTAQAATLSSSAFPTNGDGISFAEDTTVFFKFAADTRGMGRSDFGVYDSNKNLLETLLSESGAGYDRQSNDGIDWRLSIDQNAPAASFKFLASETYYLGLESEIVSRDQHPDAKGWATARTFDTIYSDTAIRTGAGAGDSHLKVIGGAGSYTFNTVGPTALRNGATLTQETVDIVAGEVLLAWEDSPVGSDGDFNDIIISAYIDDNGDLRPDTESVPEPSTAGALLGVGVLGLFNLRRKIRKNG